MIVWKVFYKKDNHLESVYPNLFHTSLKPKRYNHGLWNRKKHGNGPLTCFESWVHAKRWINMLKRRDDVLEENSKRLVIYRCEADWLMSGQLYQGTYIYAWTLPEGSMLVAKIRLLERVI